MSLTIKNWNAICRDIVIRWPASAGHDRINTFAVFDDLAEVNADNLGKTYEDYLYGSFWSRAWVHAGAKRTNLRKQYGLFLMENKQGKIRDKDLYLDCFISILLKDDGERSEQEIDERLTMNVAHVMSELHKYELRRITPTDSPPYDAWLTLAQVMKLESDPKIDSTNDLNVRLSARIGKREAEVFKLNPDFIGIDNTRGMAMQLQVNICPVEELTFSDEVDDLSLRDLKA